MSEHPSSLVVHLRLRKRCGEAHRVDSGTSFHLLWSGSFSCESRYNDIVKHLLFMFLFLNTCPSMTCRRQPLWVKAGPVRNAASHGCTSHVDLSNQLSFLVSIGVSEVHRHRRFTMLVHSANSRQSQGFDLEELDFPTSSTPVDVDKLMERGREETCDFQTKSSELYWEVIVSQFFMRSFRRCLLLEDDSSSASQHASHLLAYLETTAVHIPTLLQNDGSLRKTFGNNVRMNCAP